MRRNRIRGHQSSRDDAEGPDTQHHADRRLDGGCFLQSRSCPIELNYRFGGGVALGRYVVVEAGLDVMQHSLRIRTL
jgi:hypothetical protein